MRAYVRGRWEPFRIPGIGLLPLPNQDTAGADRLYHLAVSQIPEIINASAIPILVFLAGLQSIPSSLYECAKIEGATGWESFWKITFPLISPLFLTNIVYIIVDSFTTPSNQLTDLIYNTAWLRNMFGASVAMTWLYFAAIGLIIIVIFAVLARRVVYMEE